MQLEYFLFSSGGVNKDGLSFHLEALCTASLEKEHYFLFTKGLVH